MLSPLSNPHYSFNTFILYESHISKTKQKQQEKQKINRENEGTHQKQNSKTHKTQNQKP